MLVSLERTFVKRRQSLIWGLMRIVQDLQIAEDIAQDAYLRTRSVLDSRPIEHIDAFLHKTARNLAFDYQRKRKVREQVEAMDRAQTEVLGVAAEEPQPDRVLLARERKQRFDQALAALPERTRQVFILSRVEGWPYPEIAKYLGVSERTVWADVKMAMAHCRDALDRFDRS